MINNSLEECLKEFFMNALDFLSFFLSVWCCFSAHRAALTADHTESVRHKRRTLIAPDINLSLDKSEASLLSDDFLETPDDLDINVDDLDTPDDDSLGSLNNGNELEWEGQPEVKGRDRKNLVCRWKADCCFSDDTAVASAKGPGGEEGDGAGRLWRTVILGDQEHRIDMRVIRPYLRVVTHGGQSSIWTHIDMTQTEYLLIYLCIPHTLHSSFPLSTFIHLNRTILHYLYHYIIKKI